MHYKPFKIIFLFLNYIYFCCVCAECRHTHARVWLCRSEDNLEELVLFFYCRIQGSNLLSHLTGLINLLLVPDFCLFSPSSAAPFVVVTQWGLREVSRFGLATAAETTFPSLFKCPEPMSGHQLVQNGVGGVLHSSWSSTAFRTMLRPYPLTLRCPEVWALV